MSVYGCKHDPLNNVIAASKNIAMKRLHDKNIDDRLIVKVKDIKQYDWLALYRSLSQFTSRPIFWINKDLPNRLKEMDRELGTCSNEYAVVTDNILHEYGHVIAEWGKERNLKITELIKANWEKEELFAEDFKDYINDSMFSFNDKVHKKIIQLYMKDLEG